MAYRNYIVSCLLILSSFLQPLMAQSFDTNFGKNRVQYNTDFKYWSQYESENFITYWYGKGKNVAHTVIQMAEYDHEQIRKEIEHRMTDKIEIIVYVDLNDFNQTNIGSEEIVYSESGETKIIGNKMLVYFDGDHLKLREKVKEGIASVYFSSMFFGNNIQEIVQNAVLLDLPLWFKSGFIAYASSPWDIHIEDELRDALAKDKKHYNFKKLASKHPRVAGHSLWYFLRLNYGRSAISNLLYLTRISRNLDKSIEFTLNTSLEQIYKEWAKYYEQKYKMEEGKFGDFIGEPLKLKNKKYNPFSNLKIAPDNASMLYVVNEKGKSKVYNYDFKQRKSTCIFKTGTKNKFQEAELQYPALAYNDMGSEVTLTYQKRDRIYIKKIILNTKEKVEQILPQEFQMVHNIDYIDSRYYLINATVDGYSDLFIYDSKERESIALTQDYYDDIDASVTYIDGEKVILFVSNRNIEHILPAKHDTILPVNDYDIYYYTLPDIESKYDIKSIPKTLTRVTQTLGQNERYPKSTTGNHITYLSDRSGIVNTYVINAEGNEDKALSNLSRNIIKHDVSSNGRLYVYTYFNNGQFKVNFKEDFTFDEVQPFTTPIKQKKEEEKFQNKKSIIEYHEIPEGLKFQSVFKDINKPTIIKLDNHLQNEHLNINHETINQSKIEPINSVRTTAAGLKFRFDRLTTRMDNEVLFEGLELAQGQNAEVSQTPLGFLAKASVTDLFEDYTIEAGARISTNLDGAEYFLTYDNEKTLFDKRFAIYLRRFTESPLGDFAPAIISKKQTMIGLYRLKYPFNTYQSISATSSLRLDKQFYKSSEIVTHDFPQGNEKRLGLKFEYIYDNSFEYSLNILHGTRFKAYIELHNQFNFEFGNNQKIDLNQGFTSVIGFDARHYIPFLDHSIVALRATSAFSFGSKLNLYYLGGINNSFFPSFNNDIPLPNDTEFAFKSNAPHLRGFDSNIRNGSRFALMNTEVRVPVFKYLLGKDRGKSFFNNFQVIAFLDAGLAWYGKGPYDSKNPLNTVTVDGVLIDLNIQYFRDPLVLGYGWGLRTKLLGYFIRFDIANGYDTQKVTAKKYHIGMGFDF